MTGASVKSARDSRPLKAGAAGSRACRSVAPPSSPCWSWPGASPSRRTRAGGAARGGAVRGVCGRAGPAGPGLAAALLLCPAPAAARAGALLHAQHRRGRLLAQPAARGAGTPWPGGRAAGADRHSGRPGVHNAGPVCYDGACRDDAGFPRGSVLLPSQAAHGVSPRQHIPESAYQASHAIEVA